MILPLYVIIGLVYLLINIFVRKLDTYDDPMLPLVWWFLWPICLAALISQWTNKQITGKV